MLVALHSRYSSSERDKRLQEFDRLKKELSALQSDGKKLRICVAGDFNSGKSTFINNLIGEELLIMKPLPETHKVTTITYAEDPEFLVIKKNGYRETLSRYEYQNYSSRKSENDPNLSDVSHFEVKIPCDEMLRHVKIIDTPGFNAAQDKEESERATTQWINDSDYLIWVSMADTGTLKENEKKEIRGLGDKIIIIVNQIDKKLGGKEKHDHILNGFKKACSDRIKTVFSYAAEPVLKHNVALKEDLTMIDGLLSEMRNSIQHGICDIKLKVNAEGDVYVDGVLKSTLKRTRAACDPLYISYHDKVVKHLKIKIRDKDFRAKALHGRLHKDMCHLLMTMFDDIVQCYDHIIPILQDAKLAFENFKSRCKQDINSALDKFEDDYQKLRDNLISNPPNFLKHDQGMDYLVICPAKQDTFNSFLTSNIPSYVDTLTNNLIGIYKQLLKDHSTSNIDKQISTLLNGIYSVIGKSKSVIPQNGLECFKNIFKDCRLQLKVKKHDWERKEKIINQSLTDLVFQDESLYYILRSYLLGLRRQLIDEKESILDQKRLEYIDLGLELESLIRNINPDNMHASSIKKILEDWMINDEDKKSKSYEN